MNEVRELSERQARLDGVIEKLDRRLDSIERRMTALEASMRHGFFWLIGLMFMSWLSIVGLTLWKLGGYRKRVAIGSRLRTTITTVYFV